MILFRAILIFLCVMFHSSVYSGDKPRVLFVNPSTPENPFWSKFTSVMNSAAIKLNIDLHVKYGASDRFSEREVILDIIQSSARPDYLVFSAHTDGVEKILAACEQARVYSIIVNTDILESDRGKIGFPREKFKYWIGHISPDDFAAGKALSDRLVFAAKNRFKDRPIEIIALSGARDSAVAFNRNLGLEASIADSQGEVILNELLFPGWDGEASRARATALLKRYPNTKILWAASDVNALGMLSAAQQQGYKPGENIFVGGIDWTSDGLKAIKRNEFAVSIGGHFFEGAWALVLLYDYLNGRDFLHADGVTIKTKMQMIDKSNVAYWQDFINKKRWEKMDFRSFSLLSKKGKKNYDFSTDNVKKSLASNRD